MGFTVARAEYDGPLLAQELRSWPGPYGGIPPIGCSCRWLHPRVDDGGDLRVAVDLAGRDLPDREEAEEQDQRRVLGWQGALRLHPPAEFLVELLDDVGGAQGLLDRAFDDLREGFHRIVYAANGDAARAAYTTFERTWAKRCPGVVHSLQEGGDELLTFFCFPTAQWTTLRTTNVIERLNEEFRRRLKAQGSPSNEDAALILLFGLLAIGQITPRKIDGYTAAVISTRIQPAA